MTHRIKWQLLERSYINWAGPSIEAVWGDPSGIRRRPSSASSVPSERGPFRSWYRTFHAEHTLCRVCYSRLAPP